MKIITVIPLKKKAHKGDLTYFSGLNISAGNIVSVPIRNKETLAIVTSCEDLIEAKSDVKGMDFNLKKVSKDKGSSIFLKDFIDTIFDSCRYFAQTRANAIASMIPNIFLEEYDKVAKIINNQKTNTPEDRSNLKAEKLLLQCGKEDRISTYKTLVRESFARDKSVFVILPTESDIDKFRDALSKGIDQFTIPIHGGLSEKKSLEAIEKIITSSHPVLIIGTPAYLSIPRKDIGTIILEHENSSVYRMQRKPYFDLRVFAELYASKICAKFVLADEILRYETIGRKDADNFNPLHPLSYRIDFGGEIMVENPRASSENSFSDEKIIPVFKIFSEQSASTISSALENKKNVFIFSLRKGLATVTSCKDCGEVFSCKSCGAPMVLYTSHHGKKRMFVCNRCEQSIEGDVSCVNCGSWNLVSLGIGTDTVKDEIEKLFPKIKIFKLDKESAKTAVGAKKIAREFEESSGSILVGTEMAFFYLKNKIPLSIIASFDSLWSVPSFKISEKIIQLIISLIGNTTDKLIIQTKNDNDATILAIKSSNLLSFVREELEDRKKLDYPPFKRFIKITHMGDKIAIAEARKTLEEIFRDYNPEIFSGFVEKLRDKYITNALIKISPEKWSLPELKTNSNIDENLLNKLLSLPATFEIFVDPEDLL